MLEVNSVKNTLDILDLFVIDTPELGVTEVSKKLKLSKSTTSRLMYTLKERGFLVQSQARGKYILSGKVASLADAFFSRIDLRGIAAPYLENLNMQIHETVNVWILDGNQRMCIEQFESPYDVRRARTIGKGTPLHAGASGKVLLAFLPNDRRNELIKTLNLTPYTANTIRSKKLLRKELEQIREQGYAISYQERLPLVNAIAVPIKNYSGEVIAALGCSGLITSFTPERMQNTLIAATQETAAKISRDLGYTKKNKPVC